MIPSLSALPERPLERLNYYNGQRLEASDLRTEQDYHVRVRRWLNKSLYSSGIAAGLRVTAKPDDKHKVIVSPGMALDSAGREIILLEECEVQVAGAPSPIVGLVYGNYLVIEYTEVKASRQKDGCSTPLKNGDHQNLAWGGPTRIRSEPAITWQARWPKPESNQIVLAQVELDDTCKVRQVHTAVRQYVGCAKADTVRPLSLEGEKDIDPHNSKVIYFHIRDGFPNRVLLCLRGERFSSLYYSEMGNHTHVLTTTEDKAVHDFTHDHTASAAQTASSGKHSHELHVDRENPIVKEAWATNTLPYVEVQPRPDPDYTGPFDGLISTDNGHQHDLPDFAVDKALNSWTHAHNVNVTAAYAGTPDKSIRTGDALTYIKDLQIALDGNDITQLVLAQLYDRDVPWHGPNADPATDPINPWKTLGDGAANHALVKLGTQGIELNRLDGVQLIPNEHQITLSVKDGGGKIHYNLYVE